MKLCLWIILLLLLPLNMAAQENTPSAQRKLYVLETIEHNGEVTPHIKLPTVQIFAPLQFKNNRQRKEYNKLVRDVKKTLPLAAEIRKIIIETYELLQMMPDEKARKKHLKKLEDGLKEQYTPKMKKLTLRQGKLLIKLVDRECNQSAYQLVKLFIGSFKAAFYNSFASLFGASLKKEYDPDGEDWMIERVVIQVLNGQL